MNRTKNCAFLIVIILLLTMQICHRIDKDKYDIPEPVDSVLAEEYMPDKIWLHRTNSVEKQKELAYKYRDGGIELDIIFHKEDMAFENSHDEEDPDKYRLDYQFETYKDLGFNEGIWLDFKNLEQYNKNEARQVMDSLLRKYGISKDKVWLESGNWLCLDVFRRNGYKTSYYLPYYDFENMTDEELEKVKAHTVMVANSGNIDAISFAGKYYDFIKEMDLPENIVLLTWLDSAPWEDILLNPKYKEILDDDRIKVILVKDHGQYHR